MLKVIVEEFVKTSEPIGSSHVVEMLPFSVSSATIRNDMTELAEAGYIVQPHTSAGRVPTELGYRVYVEQTMREQKELSLKQREVLLAHFKKLTTLQEKFKEAARILSELSGSVGLLIDEKDQVYMSGLANLLKLPEFRDEDFGGEFMSLLEDPAQQLKDISREVDHHPTVLMGSENPLVDRSSIVITRIGPSGKQIISVMGPMRMSYGKTLPAIEFITKLLEEDER